MADLKKNSIKVIYYILKNQLENKKLSLKELAGQVYADDQRYTKKKGFAYYTCKSCGNSSQPKALGQTNLGKRKCRLKMKNGKRCNAIREKTWEEKRMGSCFITSDIANRCKHNLKNREIKELKKLKIIKKTKDVYEVNLLKLLTDLYYTVNLSALLSSSYDPRVRPRVISKRFSNLLKNKELCLSLFCIPFDLVGTNYEPKSYKEYLDRIIECLAYYSEKKFENNIKKYLKLNKKEIKELKELQHYCIIEKLAKERTIRVASGLFWAPLDREQHYDDFSPIRI